MIAKRRARPAASQRMEKVLRESEAGSELSLRPIGDLFDGVEWVGVVHADANRLGSFFLSAADVLGDLEPPGTPDQLSDDVRWCAENAFGRAVARVAELCGRSDDLPVVPLVIGGDDLTVLMDGAHALAFTTTYLSAFGEYVAGRVRVRRVAERVNGEHGLTASAGVAIVKPHFPFSTAYRLADQLCGSAKRVAREHPGAHALDTHVLVDSTVSDLPSIRAGYRVPDGDQVRSATQRPFLVGARAGQDLPAERDWAVVARDARAVRASRSRAGDAPAVVTRSQLHALRSELRTDLDRARRRLSEWERRAEAREDRELLAGLIGTPTSVLDLLELSEFTDQEVAR